MADSKKAEGNFGTGIAVEPVLDVFISYSQKDAKAAKRLERFLKQNKLAVWLAESNLVPGELWLPEIEKILKTCRSVAVLIGKAGVSPWQNEEVRAAINRRVADTEGLFRLIPVLLPGVDSETVVKLPFLSATTWVKFQRSIDEEDAIDRLVCGIRGLEPGSVITTDTVQFKIKLEGTMEGLDREKLDAIMELMRKHLGSPSLKLEAVKKGSIVLIIEGDQIAFERLEFLFKTGQLTQLLDMNIQEVTSQKDASRSNTSSSSSNAAF